MSDAIYRNGSAVTRSKFFYGWVIVGICTLMIMVSYGMMYSYSVFFKALADFFREDRATISLVFSAALIIRGAVSIAVGWLADKYGPVKLSIFCGFMIGLGLILSSQVQTLGQLFFTFSVIEAIGLSGAFVIGISLVSRWFTKNRGLALGIASTGSGLGTLLIVPGTERLLNAFGWSQSFFICGVIGGVVMIAVAFFLRLPPQTVIPINGKDAKAVKAEKDSVNQKENVTLRGALLDSRMLLVLGAFLLFFFCIQLIMVHLVNYATDIGITPLVAATLISLVGAISIGGRLASGIGADKIGVNNTLILTRIFLVISFVVLIFSRSLWSFYLFALIFGFAYGGEVPQIPLIIGKFFGTKAMATLVGLVLFVGNIGGALGPWVAGKIFDSTQSYQWAFIVGALAGLGSLVLACILKKQSRENS